MSVPVNRRGKSKFEVLLKSRELAKYTLEITKNQNIFKAEYKSSLTDDIIKNAKDVYIKSCTANQVKVEDEDSFKKRRNLQLEAISCCNTLLALISLALRVFHLRSKRIEYWVGLTLGSRKLIQEWKNSDKKRYCQNF